MKVTLSLAALTAVGFQMSPNAPPPAIVTSKLSEGQSNLINVVYESNPLYSTVDQKIHVRGRPIEVVYDGKTISKLVNCFTVPQDAKLIK